MRTLILIAVGACLASCAVAEVHERHVYTLYGDQNALPEGDLFSALTVLDEWYGSELSITRVYIIDRSHLKVRCWPKNIETWMELEKIDGRWRITKRSNHALEPTPDRR